MTAPWRPDRVFVINLKRRPDRRATMEQSVRYMGGAKPIWLDAVDGESEVLIPDEWQASREAWGNMMSHRRALSGNDPTDTIMVLEDDAEIGPRFWTDIQSIVALLPPYWESLYLGGQMLKAPHNWEPGVSRPTQVFRTLAYVLRGRGIETALDANVNALNHWDLLLGDALIARNTCFVADPFIVRPTGSPSDIPDSLPYPTVV
jgi:hypothetical protein